MWRKPTLKYDVFGSCEVKVDINEAKTNNAVKEPMNLYIIVCVKKNGWYRHVICTSTSVNFGYKYNNYIPIWKVRYIDKKCKVGQETHKKGLEITLTQMIFILSGHIDDNSNFTSCHSSST